MGPSTPGAETLIAIASLDGATTRDFPPEVTSVTPAAAQWTRRTGTWLMSSMGVGELGLHLFHETRGLVSLRRLAATTPAFALDLTDHVTRLEHFTRVNKIRMRRVTTSLEI